MKKSSISEGLAIGGQDLLYKFYLPKGEKAPDGVRHVNQIPDAERDRRNARHAKAEGRGRQAVVGRVRPGRVDTGFPVYQNVPKVRIASLRSLLAREGYRLSDVHYFVNNRDQTVIVMRLSTDEDALKLPRKVLDVLRALARERVWMANVWDNPGDQPSTVNFTSPSKGEADQMFVVRDDFLRLVDLDGTDPFEIERDEEARVAEALLVDLSEN